MPVGVTTPTLIKAGCFEADSINIINTALAAANTSPGIVGTTLNNSAVPFGNYTTGGTAVTLLPAGAPAGTYRITISAVITTTFTGATAVQHNLGWTDDQGARTQTNALGALTAGTNQLVTATVRSTGAAAITLTEVGTVSNATAGAMAITATVERLA